MKKGVLFLAIISIAFTSCGKDTTYTYIYENRSGHDITIEEYIDKKVNDIDIPNGEDYIYILYMVAVLNRLVMSHFYILKRSG